LKTVYVNTRALITNNLEDFIMNKAATILAFVFAVLFLSAPHAEAQWTQMNGPFGGTVYCITPAPNGTGGTNLFAGTQGNGIFRSVDNGTSWTACNTGLPIYVNTVRTIAVSGSNLFAGVLGGGVFVSNNHGASWTAVNSGLTNLEVYTVVVFGTKLVAGTYGGGTFFSDNNGVNWTAMNTGLGSLEIKTLAVCGTDLYSGTFFDGVYRLRISRKGNSWKEFNKGMSASNNIINLTSLGTDLFAGTSVGVYLSANGKPWRLRNTGISTYYYAQGFARIGNNTFVATQNAGVFVSINNGKNWTQVNTGLTETWLRSLASNGSTLYAGANRGGGVFISANLGTSWAASNTGLNASNISAITTSGTNLIAGAQNGVYYSANNGATWTSAGLTYQASSFVSNAAGLFVGTTDNGVYFSNDNGVSWTARHNGLQGQVNALAVKGSNIFAATGGAIYVSANNGATWIPTSMTGRSVSSFAVIGNSIFAGINRGNTTPTQDGVYRSTDDGVTWTVVNPGWTGYVEVNGLAVIGTDLYASVNRAESGPGIYVTSDQGTSWTKVSNWSLHKYAVSGSNLFGSLNDGVFVSSTGGTSWTAVNSGLTNKNIDALTVIGTDLLAGSFGAGIWTRPLIQMPKQSSYEYLPAQFVLNQNYPNPFNPSTTITYSIPEDGMVQLRVFDVYGRVVSELENGIKMAGSYSAVLDAHSLSSGVYYYRLETNDQILTRSMILMK
jgi:Secretion system C-terminal sorting domain